MVEIVRASRAGGVSRPAMAMAGTKPLERRIVALLQPDTNRARVSRRIAFVTACSTLLLVLPLAALTPGTAVEVDVRPVALPAALQAPTAAAPAPATPMVRSSRVAQARDLA